MGKLLRCKFAFGPANSNAKHCRLLARRYMLMEYEPTHMLEMRIHECLLSVLFCVLVFKSCAVTSTCASCDSVHVGFTCRHVRKMPLHVHAAVACAYA
jgi:hypothetical protein